MTDAPDLMRKAIETFAARSSYGPADFKKQGTIMHTLFPDGMQTLTVEQCSRFVVLSIIVTKLCRYAEHAHDNGHDDSIHDIGVYSFILQAMDIASRDEVVDRPTGFEAFQLAASGIDPKSEQGVAVHKARKALNAARSELPDYAIDRWVERPAIGISPLVWEGYPRRGGDIYRITEVPGGWSYLTAHTGAREVPDLQDAKNAYEVQALTRGAEG